MIFSYLKPDNLAEKYTAAKEHTKKLTERFPEHERIARNKPREGISKELPKVTDGTSASIIRKTGRRVVQQLPTGVVISDDDQSWLPIVAGFIFTNKILPYANAEYDLIQKTWNTIERGLTFGSCAIYTPFLNHDGHFSTDYINPYWGDIFIQPGKKSGYECDYVFLRTWWVEDDIEALINREKKLIKEAKKAGREYESTWDLKNLEYVKDHITNKDEEAKTPSEEETQTNISGIEVITGFQKGVGAPFYTFVLGCSDDIDEATVIRIKQNRDPRGLTPIDWFYADIDGSSPLGRGLLDLIAPIQDLIDSDMQAYQYGRALMLQPPIKKRGSMSAKKIVFAPNAVIDLGTDQSNDIEPLTVDTSAVTNYPQLYGLQKSQLLNLVSSPDTSISAEIGNPGFGKTPAALNQQAANISVDDNFVRKMFEAAFEHWAETAINLYFAEREGVEELQLDDKTASELRRLADDGKFDISQLSEDNKLVIDYSTATPALYFRVDASTSKMKDDNAQGEILMGLLQSLEGSQLLSQTVPQDKIMAAWNRLVSSSGVEDPEELQIDIKEWKKQQELMAQQAMAQQAMPPIDPEDEIIIAELQQLGFGEDTIGMAIDMLNQGATPEQVFSNLAGVPA